MREHSPLFSIITVCLNPGSDLDPTVESVLGQDFKDYELIIKDGGSSDGTQNRTWANPRVRFHSSPDAGIFDAMNQALGLATGKLVCFLNAGDYFVDPQVLGDVAKVAAQDGDAKFLYGDVFKAKGRAGVNIYPERLSRFFLFTQMICHQCWFVRRATYLSYGGFETQYRAGADCRLLLKMMVRDRLKYQHVARVIAYYKGGGFTFNPAVKRLSCAWEKKLRQELFSPLEYFCFSLLWGSWTAIKPVIYDHFLSVFWRRIQHYRAFRNQARIKRNATC